MTTATTAAAATVYVALVGDDGLRPVVWGIGAADDEEDATVTAEANARHYLDGAVDVVDGEVEGLRAVEIDAVTFRAIEDGEVDAVALGLA